MSTTLTIKPGSPVSEASIFPLGHGGWQYSPKLILLLISFSVTSSLSTWKCWSFSWENVFRPPQKPWLWTEKKTEGKRCYIWRQDHLQMLRTQALCWPSSQQNRLQRWRHRRQIRNLNILPCTNKTLSILLNFFFPLIKLLLTFVVFAKTRVTMRIRAQKRWRKHRVISSACHLIGDPVVRTNGHVTITSLPKFLGLIGYQIC